MAQRGAYSKGVAKREEIITAALGIVARAGYSNTTIREIAGAVGLSQTGLLHYFGTKEQLFIEVLRRRDHVDRHEFGSTDEGGGPAPNAGESVARLVHHNAEVPGLVQLYARFSSDAAEPGHPAHEYFRERYELTRKLLQDSIERMRADGRLQTDLSSEHLAVIMVALIDGLQMQWMYEPAVDMADHVSQLWSLITTSPGH